MSLTNQVLPVALSKLGHPLLRVPRPYIVCYSLSWPEEQYTSLLAELQNSLHWWHFIPGVWITVRRETLVDFSQMLRQCVTGNDLVMILPAKGPGNGLLPTEAWNWINTHLPREW
jgi:hypothetical protein